MKKITTLLLLAFSLGAMAQNVNIPDANFKAALVANTAINTNNDTEIQVSEAEAFTGTINVAFQQITDLTGIEAFVNITGLTCYYNQLTSLDVSKNTSLTSLDCYENQLTSLDVAQNTALTKLDCNSNQLTSLDVSKNTALTRLDCYSNQLTSLDVTKNTSLTTLNCYNNKITSLDVTQNTSLVALRCESNQLTSLDVWDLKSLYFLDARDNAIKRIVIREENTTPSLQARMNVTEHQLKELYVNDNQLTELDLTSLPNLQTVDCSNNPLLNTIYVNSVAGANASPSFTKDASAEWKERTVLSVSESGASTKATVIKAYNLLGQEVPADTKGEVIILLYDNGSKEKTYVTQ